jgi:uncharacterized protein (TIGR03435 family)
MTGTALALLICWGSANGQTADTRPVFEAASVKPAGPFVPTPNLVFMRGGPGSDDPGQIAWTRVTLTTVLTRAYEVSRDQISGPDWLNTEMYSIVAKIPRNTTSHQFDLMLQDLLAKRFHLTLHHATRDFPAYDLVVASGGPKMKPWRPDANAVTVPPASATFPHGLDKGGFPVLPPGATTLTTIRNGVVYSTNRSTMAGFAAQLGGMVNLSDGSSSATPRVVDKTGLTGKFDFRLEFAMSVMPLSGERGDQPPPDESGASDLAGSGGPTLFTALEKQLGLRLQKGKKASLDLLVIDHVDKVPTQN